MDPDAAVALLHELADAAIDGVVEPVVSLGAPEWPPLPDYLRRDLDGRSVYTRPGTTRYATRVQLSLEEQLLRDAQRNDAPHLARDYAAALLGADATTLETQLRERAQDDRAGATGAGLRLDQSAALFHALTSKRTVEVLIGPAGSGKTRTLAVGARVWAESGKGPVIGIATAQAARNVLASAGVHLAENSAVFLGHLPGARGALGIRDIGPGALLIIDEASMMSLPDLAEIVAHAARCGAKVIIAGDSEQLAAVESGGGLTLLARRLGYVQLAEAVRFAARWERDASLRLRAGDATALDDYHQHGRIRGAVPEQAMDDAVRTYVAHYLAGDDVLLMISDRERCREASRRVRDNLIHLGIVDDSREIKLAGGARASVGDLIICRRNNHRLEAGEPGRTLANGDTLRIESIGRRHILVRRALDCDPATGARRWTKQALAYSGYRGDDLAYAVTGHSAQGRTVKVGIPVLTGNEDRQWLYVAMTRGSEKNVMIAFTRSARLADPEAGTRPAPEISRHERSQRERAGLPLTPVQAGGSPEPRDAIAVAADILGLKDSQESALETRGRSLSNADHLAVLHAIWHEETRGIQAERYRQLVLAELPPEYAADGLTSPQATWLWRTLRAAEVAGLDVGAVVQEAVGARSLSGARDVASVIDSRLRPLVDPLVPRPLRPWSERVPQVSDPERQRFLTDLAVAMDARKDRIGEHLAQYPPSWGLRTLGPVPEHPLDRLEWQRRAADIGAYRELYGYDHPSEPIGAEPPGDSPEKRAAWHAAFIALGPVDGVDVRGLADGSLLHMRASYMTETAWAPRHVGRELQHVRLSADDASLAAIRARAEQRVAQQRCQGELAERHGGLARSWAAMEAFYRKQEAELERTMEVRREWEQATAQSRRLALAADSELRRRHPDRRFQPLRSTEPLVTQEERNQLILTAREVDRQQPEWITKLAAERHAAHEQVAERRSMRIPAEDPAFGYEGQAWPTWTVRDREAILQPPKPEIRPAAPVLQLAAEIEAEAER
jgi:hypothetical protein